MDDFDLEIKTEFINEALMNLEEAEGSFMELEGSADPKPLLDKIFRVAHNLKGGSRAVGFGDVAEFTHQLENLVQKIQKSEVALSPDVVTTLLRSNDRVVEMLNSLKSDMSAKFDNSDILAEIQGWINGTTSAQPVVDAKAVSDAEESLANPSAELIQQAEEATISVVEEAAPAAPDANAFFADTPAQVPQPAAQEPTVQQVAVVMPEPVGEAFITHEKTIETVASPAVVTTPAPIVENDLAAKTPSVAATVISQVEQKASAPQSPSQAPAKKQQQEGKSNEDEVIRVNLSRIDLLNDYVGELIVLQSVVQQQAMTNNPIKLQASIRQVMKLSKDIQSLSMSLRMLPVKPLVQKLQRVVRDTARALGKEVDLQVVGEQMEIDKSVLDRLADPLIHILRNAVDHGLEMPDVRKESGKNIAGSVTLSFFNEGNHLVVEARDDGKGINAEILRKKAIEKKLISESQAMTEKQLINLIFHPGFSTKSEASEISGRGVGMDVVKTNVEKIGGHVDVTTQVGKGSIFRLQIPLSLAVIEGLVVTSEKSRYVVPLSQVQETINLKTQKLHTGKLGVGSCFELRGEIVPLFSLDEAVGIKKAPLNLEGTALIVNIEDRPIGFVVHDILRAQQIVIKPLGNGIVPQNGWVGSCVLGDGQPTLILSPVDLLKGKVKYGIESVQSDKANSIGGAA